MNENIDLKEILKDCPIGWKFWSPIFGEVDFQKILNDDECAIIVTKGVIDASFTKEGFYYADLSEECLLFPSKEQRDWSKFTAPWYNNEKNKKFDPKTLNAFDKVLARVYLGAWFADFVSVPGDDELCDIPSLVGSSNFNEVVPYNDDTKHLLGTTDDAPEYYQYVGEDDEWED